MAQIHLALAYRGKHRDDRPHVAYCGPDADACQREIDGALSGGVFVRTERYRLSSPLVKFADRSVATEEVANEEVVASPKKKAPKKKATDPPD